MRGFLRSNTFKLFLLLIVSFGILTVLTKTVGNVSLASFLGMVSTPMQEKLTELTSEQKEMFSNMSREELEIYCNEILSENDEFRQMLISYYDIKRENELYKEALDFSEEKPEIDFVPAVVISRDTSDVTHGFTISIGENSGIEVGNCVVTASGLVGLIDEIGSNWAKVKTIYSSDFSVGAVANEFNETAVLSGDEELVVSGYVKLEYLKKTTEVKVGTIITTSGNSGKFPEDFPIGVVEKVQPSANDISFSAMVKPYANIANVDKVFVVKTFGSEEE